LHGVGIGDELWQPLGTQQAVFRLQPLTVPQRASQFKLSA